MTLPDDAALARWAVAAALITGFAAMVFAPFITVFVMDAAHWPAHPTPFWQPFTPLNTGIFGAFRLGLFTVMSHLLGWDGVSTILAGIDNPLKLIPCAMLAAVPLIILAYLPPALIIMLAVITVWDEGSSFQALAPPFRSRPPAVREHDAAPLRSGGQQADWDGTPCLDR